MGQTIAEYAAAPIADAYETLKEEFREAKAAQTKVPEESSKIDNGNPSGKAYLVLAGVVVTLLAPLKIIGCLVSLLLNYAYSPVTIILTGLLLLIQKIGWMEILANFSTAGACIFWVAFWPLAISYFMADHTTAENMNEDTVYIDKLHFLQKKLFFYLEGNQSEDEQSHNGQGMEGQWGDGMA
jgi:hypothetical protein